MKLELPALSNPTIVHCRKAMEKVALEKLIELGIFSSDGQPLNAHDVKTEYDLEVKQQKVEDAYKKACDAYREAMPPLTGDENIRDFIACVGHGMLLRVIGENEATKLLYAAQVAAMAEAKRQKSRFDAM